MNRYRFFADGADHHFEFSADDIAQRAAVFITGNPAAVVFRLFGRVWRMI